MTTRRTLTLLLCAFLAACGGGGDDDGGGGGGDGGADGDGGGGGGNGDGGGNLADACKKIDLVISLDASGSMSEELEAMSGIFGDFANALLDVSADFENFRTGVTDACPASAPFLTVDQNDTSCNFGSGEAWIDSASPTMVQEFQCVGDIDPNDQTCDRSQDAHEQPIKAALASLAGAANPGFLRDDALLVVLAITDEDEEMVLDGDREETWTGTELDGHAQSLYDQLVAVKGGDVRRMVFISIAGGLPDGCTQNAGTYGTADPAEVMDATADLFIAENRGVNKDICQGDLAQALSDAMAVIETACAEFPPVE